MKKVLEPINNHFLGNNIIEIIQKTIDESKIKIDFKALKNKYLYNEYIILKNKIKKPNGGFNTTDESLIAQYEKIEQELKNTKLSKNDLLIICIEEFINLCKKHNKNICTKNDKIFLYNSQHWVEIEHDLLKSILSTAALNMGIDEFICKHHTFKEDLMKQFYSYSYIPMQSLKNDNVLINFLNGTFEMNCNGFILRDFNQEDFLMYQLPFKFDPNATAPLFEKYLNEVLPDKSKQKVLAEYCGYIFTKNLKLEKALILYGTGANGKSVFFEILTGILGSTNVSSYSISGLTNDKNYTRAQIANKLVNYASEFNGKLDMDVFKKLVSNEPIEVRSIYGNPYQMVDYAKLIFNCNTLPEMNSKSNAFLRRLLILHFQQTITKEKQDPDLHKKILSQEASGVFNWMLEGLKSILSQKRFSECKAIEKTINDYADSSNSIQFFIDETNLLPSPKNNILKSSLYEKYVDFCIKSKLKFENRKIFEIELKNKNYSFVRITNGWACKAIFKNEKNEKNEKKIKTFNM